MRLRRMNSSEMPCPLCSVVVQRLTDETSSLADGLRAHYSVCHPEEVEG